MVGIGAVVEVEHDCHREVHIAGAVQIDYSHGAPVHIVLQTADKTGTGEHCAGECQVHCSVCQVVPWLMIRLTVLRKGFYRFYITLKYSMTCVILQLLLLSHMVCPLACARAICPTEQCQLFG